jgi:FAD/FMN-containing dehydrogenase
MRGIRSFACGHFGDGNIPLQAREKGKEIWRSRFLAVNRLTHDSAIEMGGWISAEHGIGELRQFEFARYKNGLDMDLMRSFKADLDPLGLLNLGLLFRTGKQFSVKGSCNLQASQCSSKFTRNTLPYCTRCPLRY